MPAVQAFKIRLLPLLSVFNRRRRAGTVILPLYPIVPWEHSIFAPLPGPLGILMGSDCLIVFLS